MYLKHTFHLTDEYSKERPNFGDFNKKIQRWLRSRLWLYEKAETSALIL